MRLAFVNSSFPRMPCGVGDYAAQLARAARDAGHHVVVFTSADERVAPAEGLDVRPVFRDWAIRDFFVHRGKIRRERPDVVVLQYPSVLPGAHSRLLFLFPLLARLFLPSTRVVLVVHEYAHTHERARRRLGLAFRFAHEVVAVTPSDQRAIAERHPRLGEKLRGATIGSNVPHTPLTAERRAELAAETDGPTVLFFGLLHGPDKGLDDLLEAIAEGTSATLLVGGSLDDAEPYHRQVRERIESLGLAERVRWLGFLEPDELSERLQTADVVALPFRMGAAANRGTLAAALVNGSATVTTAGPETPDYLRDGENVALVPPHDPASLAAALERLLASSAERERLREGAGRLAKRFEWTAVVGETLGTAAAPPGGEWPSDGLERVPRCPVCGGSGREQLYSGLTDRVSLVAPGTWTLWSCASCGAAYLDPRPTDETIGLAYRSYHTHSEPAPAHRAPPGLGGRLRWALANGYLNERYGYDFKPSSRAGGRLASLSPRRRWLADMRVRHLPRPAGAPRLLDVGCGNGTFLRDMRDAGWEVSGIDPDPGAVASARATGARVEEGLLTRDTFPAGSFDAVTLSHVIEHLPDPADTLGVCFDLLRPGGYLWIATPNLESRGHRRYGRCWRGLEPPRHLAIFTAAALTGLLERLGFEVVATPRNYMAQFFFRASAAIATGQDPEDASLREPPGLRRQARRADALTVWRPRGAEELIAIARRPASG